MKTHQQQKFTVTYFDANSHKTQTETFGMLECATLFARGLRECDGYRIMQVWDVYSNLEIDLDQPNINRTA